MNHLLTDKSLSFSAKFLYLGMYFLLPMNDQGKTEPFTATELNDQIGHANVNEILNLLVILERYEYIEVEREGNKITVKFLK